MFSSAGVSKRESSCQPLLLLRKEEVHLKEMLTASPRYPRQKEPWESPFIPAPVLKVAHCIQPCNSGLNCRAAHQKINGHTAPSTSNSGLQRDHMLGRSSSLPVAKRWQYLQDVAQFWIVTELCRDKSDFPAGRDVPFLCCPRVCNFIHEPKLHSRAPGKGKKKLSEDPGSGMGSTEPGWELPRTAWLQADRESWHLKSSLILPPRNPSAFSR